MSIGIGLHRNQKNLNLSAVEREHRRRVWWTVYCFERLSSSRLGYPTSIQDDVIDVEYPSMSGLSDSEKEEFNDPEHLCANVKLTRITGRISMCHVFSLANSIKISL